ncbi:MAG: MFS transporter, partial [Vallitaleaceae bacterium]|nr:MFS transporter [Vallitaleaceae bacterium]
MKNPIVAVKESYGGLPRSIYALFVARIINRMGGFVHAFLALYLSTKLGYSEGQIAEYIILVGVLSTFAPFIGGRIADKRGRKIIYIVAQSLAAFMFIPCGLLTESNPELVPIFLILASMISSIVDPINGAMVADIAVSAEDRKKAYALLYLGTNVGVAVGPMIGGFLLNRYVVLFFIGDAVTTFISVLLIAFFVRETKLSHEEMKKIKGSEKMEEGNTLQVLMKKPVLLLFALFSILTSIVYAQSNFGMSLFMAHSFGAAKGPAYYGLLMSFNAIVVLLFTLPVTS